MGQRGFGAMSQERRREIASRGGRAAHANGKAHEFTSKEAKKAGKKGGEVVARDKQHMVEIGRLGGLAKHRNSQNKSDANEET